MGRVGALKSMGAILVLRVPVNLSLTNCLDAASSASISFCDFLLRVPVTFVAAGAGARTSESRHIKEGLTATVAGVRVGAGMACERSAGAQ